MTSPKLLGLLSRSGLLIHHDKIPNGRGTLRYAEVAQINNPDSSDYEKYALPVCMDGNWKCDDQFNPSDLVNYSPNWFLPPE